MSSDYVNLFDGGDTFRVYHDRTLAGGGLVSEMLRDSVADIATAPLDLTVFEALPEPVRVLVLSEDWCGDCTDNRPILDRIGRDTGKLELRIVSRDAHLDIMD